MAGTKKSKPTKLANVILVSLIVLLALGICGVFEPAKVEKIEIAYGTGAQVKAREMGKTDDSIAGDTQLYYRKMSEFDSFLNDAVARIDYRYGYLYVADVEKISSTKIRITLNCRTALAVVSGANDAVVDENGIILELRNKKVKDKLVRINGLEQKRQSVGWKIELNSSEDARLENALNVAKVINDNGYYSIFTEISMLENGQVRLTAVTGDSSSIPVYINMRYDVLHSIDIAYSILNKGVTSGGSIIVTGDNGYFSPDTGDTTTAKGM